MDRIKYGPAFGPKHGSQLMVRPTRVLKILWAYSWAGPLMSAKSHGPLAGPAHYDPQESCGLYLGRPIMTRKNLVGFTWAGPLWHKKNLVGLYLGRPIMAREILWAFSWASPLWSKNFVGL